MFHNTEPFYGWLPWYDPEEDENSPFYGEKEEQDAPGPYLYNFPANPFWDDFGSESLLVKILFVSYEEGFAIIELFGEWNDLHLNDFKMLAENVLTVMIDSGIQKFIFICENVFNVYYGDDDYYDALSEELEEGWLCVIRCRPQMIEELDRYGIDRYLFRSALLDDVLWRKLKPYELFKIADELINRLLLK